MKSKAEEIQEIVEQATPEQDTNDLPIFVKSSSQLRKDDAKEQDSKDAANPEDVSDKPEATGQQNQMSLMGQPTGGQWQNHGTQKESEHTPSEQPQDSQHDLNVSAQEIATVEPAEKDSREEGGDNFDGFQEYQSQNEELNDRKPDLQLDSKQ